MLVAVVVILSVVAVYATSLVPPAREPTVTVKMYAPENGGYVHLYHKGGDAIPKSEIRVMVKGVEAEKTSWQLLNPEGEKVESQDGLFDLGSWINVSAEKGNEVRIATYRATLFTGMVPW